MSPSPPTATDAATNATAAATAAAWNDHVHVAEAAAEPAGRHHPQPGSSGKSPDKTIFTFQLAKSNPCRAAGEGQCSLNMKEGREAESSREGKGLASFWDRL